MFMSEFEKLQNGIVLAELAGYGNGYYCASHGKGAAIVILGSYIIDAGDNVPYPKEFVFKPDMKDYKQYITEHIQAAAPSGAKICVSSLSTDIDQTVESFIVAQEAGADYVSYCAYSEMEMFVGKGLGVELCKRPNHLALKTLAHKISTAVEIPCIFKLGLFHTSEMIEAVEILANSGITMIHVVSGSTAESDGLKLLGELTGRCKFLIGGGGVTDFAGARRILSTGANAVSVGKATMKYPCFLQDLQMQLSVS
jgi:tRNA-dihydrouridine synthase